MSDSVAVIIGSSDIPKSMDGEKIQTSEKFQDVRIKVISAAMAVGIRGLRTFLQTFAAGLVGSATVPLMPGVSDMIPAGDFSEKFLLALYIAAIAALITMVQRAAEIAGKIDDKIPEWTV